MTRAARLLIVEDDAHLRGALARALTRRGHAVREAARLADLAELRDEDIAVLDGAVCDLRLPDGSGLDAVEVLRSQRPELRVVVLTGYGSIATALEAVRRGALDYLTKPADADQVLAALGIEAEAGAADSADEVPSLQRVEWEHIQRVLADCDGNITRAARALGIHRRTLQRKLAYRAPRR